MNTNKADARERKYNKNRYGMRIDGKSVFTIQETIIRKANKSKARRNSRHYVIKGS